MLHSFPTRRSSDLNSGNDDVPPTDSYAVAYWHLDEGSGSTAYDSSGSNKHGALKTGSSWTEGLFEAGVLLDGDTGRVQIPELLSNSGIFNELTIEAWIMVYSAVPDNDDFIIYAGGKDGMIEFGINDNQELYFKAKAVTLDRKSTRLNSSHKPISYAVFCLKKKINKKIKNIL